jgi:hypothetical protein
MGSMAQVPNNEETFHLRMILLLMALGKSNFTKLCALSSVMTDRERKGTK